jgi:signal transduction histidine kinase
MGERWLTVAGFGTWLVTGLPTTIRFFSGDLSPAQTVVWAITFPLFGLAFGVMCFDLPSIRGRTFVRLSLLVVQAVSGLAMVAISSDAFPAATLVIVAGQLDEVVPRAAMAWVLVQTVALGAIALRTGRPMLALAFAGAFGGFQVFALATAALATRERRAREDLARVNAELVSTRERLAEGSRIAERLRISRDLHDTLGHHLTALSLQLDVASRLSDGKAADHVRQAYAITRLLLSDVRDVVSEMRTSNTFDLGRAIHALVAESQGPAVHLELPEVLELEHGAQADALMKCVQEIVTNTRRHAAATNLWIRVETTAEGISLHARDDGRGADRLVFGHGLTGMRERFEQLSGRIDFHARAGQGFEVRGFLPKAHVPS